jgi:hypothetical protein
MHQEKQRLSRRYNRKDEISPRMAKRILCLYEDWCHLDERIETVTGEIEQLSHIEPKC